VIAGAGGFPDGIGCHLPRPRRIEDHPEPSADQVPVPLSRAGRRVHGGDPLSQPQIPAHMIDHRGRHRLQRREVPQPAEALQPDHQGQHMLIRPRRAPGPRHLIRLRCKEDMQLPRRKQPLEPRIRRPFDRCHLRRPPDKGPSHSARLSLAFDAELAGVYRAAGDRVADVAGAFATADFTGRVPVRGIGLVPPNVAAICHWTWTCARPPRGPNKHPDKAGYRAIAQAFLAAYRAPPAAGPRAGAWPARRGRPGPAAGSPTPASRNRISRPAAPARYSQNGPSGTSATCDKGPSGAAARFAE
jgi:hypothetical protein